MFDDSRLTRQFLEAVNHDPTEEEWEDHKEEIADLYRRQNDRFDKLIRYFRECHHFDATRKQWMMTLSELGLGRDMVGEDFAHFVKLFQDAEAQALSREVLFNGDLNTHADVFAYVRASGVLDSEAKLLDFIKNSPLADPVTYIDTPQPQSSGMYMHHTISRDLSGTNDQVTSKLLAALGERSSRRADLSILAERSTRKTDLSILSERSSRRADLSLLVSKSEESTSTKRTERLPFRH